jgi:hypothetical protein
MGFIWVSEYFIPEISNQQYTYNYLYRPRRTQQIQRDGSHRRVKHEVDQSSFPGGLRHIKDSDGFRIADHPESDQTSQYKRVCGD